jgi:hypothetical protein
VPRPDAAARLNLALAAIVAVAVPFAAFANLVLAHFYARGSFLLDAGLFAGLLWHGDAALTVPESLGGGSFFASHAALIFVPLTALSRMLPLSLAEFFAGFVGLCHALLALAVFWALIGVQGMRRGVAPWLACVLALGFAFSGLALAIARYPHFETLIAACFLLFAVALRQGRVWLAALCFVVGLATREDAGLHYAGVLLLLVLLERWHGAPWRAQRAAIAFAVAGALYAVAAVAAQRAVFHGGGAFARVYLGDPIYAHVTARLLLERVTYLVLARPYVVLPALAAVIWAVRARNAGVVLGYVASLPWLVLHLLAASPLAGGLASYYAFPFLIGLGWPPLAARPGRATVPAFAALLALTFVPSAQLHDPGRLDLPADFLAAPSRAQRQATDAAVAALVAAHGELGRLLVDQSVAALAPFAFAKAEIPMFANDGPADTVIYMLRGYDGEALAARAATLPFHYAAPGTDLRVASDRKLDGIASLTTE